MSADLVNGQDPGVQIDDHDYAQVAVGCVVLFLTRLYRQKPRLQ
jgi:hypothetical protein